MRYLRRRHPLDRRPAWLKRLDAEIKYWLKRTSRQRHGEPFNKTMRGKARRAERQFKAASFEIAGRS